MRESPAAVRREIAALLAIRQRGARIEPFGQGYRVVAPGVDVLVAHVRDINAMDLEPIRDDEDEDLLDD